MKAQVHRSNTRGSADHGWLKAKHTFSFADYFNPNRIHFGALRVLNDDHIAPSMGFPTHPHRDMEIVTVPLSGALEHKDSQGHQAVIHSGEVQLMSAGRGVRHSEFNASDTDEVNVLQTWVIPKERGIAPRYEQKYFAPEGRKNQWQDVVVPLTEDSASEALKINQDAYYARSDLDAGYELSYQLRQPDHGVYMFVINGEVEIGGEKLGPRDAVGLSQTHAVKIKALSASEILAIEVPMLELLY